MVLIALFSRTATHETWRPGAALPYPIDAAKLHELVRSVLRARGLQVESEVTVEDSADTVVADPTPLVGQRILVRELAQAFPAGTVEVQAALDHARGEGCNKALLVAPGGFSDEARSAAEESQIELVDGRQLLELLGAGSRPASGSAEEPTHPSS
jgi:hypothetical protein